jgi:hypothetical protein
MTDIFISYRREDSPAAAGRISDRLKTHFGKRNVTLDVDSIPAGVDFRDYIRGEVAKCDVLLVIIGDDWLSLLHEGGAGSDEQTDWAQFEIETALNRGIPVVPVLVQNAVLPKANQLPESLAELSYRNAVEVRSGSSFDGQMASLIRGIEKAARKPKGLRKPLLAVAGALIVVVTGVLLWQWAGLGTQAGPPNVRPVLRTLSVSTSQASPSVRPGEKATIYVRASERGGRRVSGAKVILEAGGGRFLKSPNERYDPNARLHGPYSVAGLTSDTGVFTATWVCNPCAKAYGMTATVSKSGYSQASADLTVEIR